MSQSLRRLACSLAFLTSAAFGAPTLAGAASPTKPTHSVVQMDFTDGDELVAKDGSRFKATLSEPPKIVGADVVVTTPWPNRFDVEPYASRTGNSRFHLESTPSGRRLVQIDVAVAQWPRQGTDIIRFVYDDAGHLLEVARSGGPAAGRAPTLTRECFVYGSDGQLLGYAANVSDGSACKSLEGDRFDQQFVHRADGKVERLIEKGFTLSLDGKAARPIRVTLYGTAGEVSGRLENDGGAAVRLPAEIKDEAIHQGYGVVTASGDVLLRIPSPAEGEAWEIVRIRAPAESTGSLFGDVLEPESVLATGVGEVRIAEAARAELARQARDQPERLFLHWRIRAKALYPALDEAQWASCIDPSRHGPAACGRPSHPVAPPAT